MKKILLSRFVDAVIFIPEASMLARGCFHMSTTHLHKMELPGRVTFLDGNGDLPKIEVKTALSNAEIYLHGAQVTHFQRKNEAPLLFLSQVSRFQQNAAIRGGIPICFPWFGPREGQTMHGFARVTDWELREITQQTDGSVSLKFSLPDSAEASLMPKCDVDYIVTVGEKLTAEFVVKNTSDQEFVYENCLHSYFTVGDINAISITGLKGATYLDKVENFARKQEANDAIKITEETDRVYLATTSTVEIHDPKLQRKIIVEKSGSNSTVVWNPWIARAQQMPDLGNEEYLRMVCVESGNVSENKTTLAPGKTATLKIVLSTAAL